VFLVDASAVCGGASLVRVTASAAVAANATAAATRQATRADALIVAPLATIGPLPPIFNQYHEYDQTRRGIATFSSRMTPQQVKT
jgi:hypothetical protein